MDITALRGVAAKMGLTITEARLPGSLRGYYDHDYRLIVLDDRLTMPQAVATLAHEIVHAQWGHDGHQHPSVEARVDEVAARMVISTGDYARAERIVGADPRALAAELGTVPWLVEAWKRAHARVGA